MRRVLVVRLRSIGDTVLATPTLLALKRFLPDAEIDVLLEDWVAPVLENFSFADSVLTVGKSAKSRLQTARLIRRRKYDVAINLHGGTTATFFAQASAAKHRVAYRNFSYSFLYNHRLPSPVEFWNTSKPHSAEQQLAMIGMLGVPVADRPQTHLDVAPNALQNVEKRFATLSANANLPNNFFENFALIHPVAAFETKQWATENFAQIAEFLNRKNINAVAVATKKERAVLEKFRALSKVPIVIFDDLTLPEITAIASRAKIFVGNDSGIAHIAAAVKTPSVVIFGSSNIHHWRPWTNAPNEIVYEAMPCQPCAGYFCKEFAEPVCIKSVSIETVEIAIGKVLYS